MNTHSIESFAAVQHIEAGDWDRHLVQVAAAARWRLKLLDQNKQPPRTGLESHQVWAWMNGPGTPHWEVRGTGALLD